MAPEMAFIVIKLQRFTYRKHAQADVRFKATFIPTKVRGGEHDQWNQCSIFNQY